MTIDHTRPSTHGAARKKGTLPAFTPVPRQRERHDGWTPERQLGFIEALADTGSVKAAAHAVNMTPEGAYLLRRHAEAGTFRKAWEAALALGVQRIEDVAMDRALNGIEVPLYSYGKLIGSRIVYNDRLLMFMLRNRAPKRFNPARGMNAVDQGRLKKLKQEWRQEWETEKEANSASPADIRASIERKVDALRKRIVWSTSPRAVELEQMVSAQRHADEAAGWHPNKPYAPFAEKAAELMPQFLVEVQAEWPEPEPYDEAEWERDGEEAERESEGGC